MIVPTFEHSNIFLYDAVLILKSEVLISALRIFNWDRKELSTYQKHKCRDLRPMKCIVSPEYCQYTLKNIQNIGRLYRYKPEVADLETCGSLQERKTNEPFQMVTGSIYNKLCCLGQRPFWFTATECWTCCAVIFSSTKEAHPQGGRH